MRCNFFNYGEEVQSSKSLKSHHFLNGANLIVQIDELYLCLWHTVRTCHEIDSHAVKQCSINTWEVCLGIIHSLLTVRAQAWWMQYYTLPNKDCLTRISIRTKMKTKIRNALLGKRKYPNCNLQCPMFAVQHINLSKNQLSFWREGVFLLPSLKKLWHNDGWGSF